MAAPDPSELLALARPAAEAAARRLVGALAHQRSDVTTKTSPTDFVTEMDRAVEAFLLESILARRPDDSVVGEEGADRVGSSGVQWLVDPIDGTVNYVHAMPGFSVSVAAAYDGVPVAGVVVSPMHGDTFTATRGGGAFRNGSPIRCADKAAPATAVIGTGFSYRPERRRAQAEVLTGVLPAVADIRRSGSAALDLCWTACGRLDAYFEAGLGPWDYAAGALIAAEAGATVGDLEGGGPGTGFVLAAPPDLFEPLRALLVASGAGPFG